MAKKSKDKKKAAEPDGSSPADAVRGAVEQALAAAFGSAAANVTRERAQDLVEDIGSATTRVRQAIEDLNVLDDLRGLRQELERLNERVEALESRSSTPTPAPKPARASAGTKPAGTRARAGAGTTRGRSAAAASKDPAKRATRAPKSGASRGTRSAASARKAPPTKPPEESSAGRS